MKRNSNETVQEFTTWFNLVYNSIPNYIKPQPGLVLLHYPDAFDPNMAYQIRERDPATLEEMQRNAISVEANFLIKKSKIKPEKLDKKVTIMEESSSSEGDLIAKKQKNNAECLQPENSPEDIVELVPETQIVETVSHPPENKKDRSSKKIFLDEEEGLWTMEFDGALGKGFGISMWIHGTLHQSCKIPQNVRLSSYKLAFDCSNYEAEYEALIDGLKLLKKLGAKRISVYRDSELVIKQVKGEYQAKHPRMRAY
eukprot:PITA_16840